MRSLSLSKGPALIMPSRKRNIKVPSFELSRGEAKDIKGTEK